MGSERLDTLVPPRRSWADPNLGASEAGNRDPTRSSSSSSPAHAFSLVILVFWLPPRTPQRVANRFSQKFYGQVERRSRSGVLYRRTGLLDHIPHRKVRRGVLILREEDLCRVTEFLDRWEVPWEAHGIQEPRLEGPPSTIHEGKVAGGELWRVPSLRSSRAAGSSPPLE
jgi:hypothetical protein